MKKISKKNGNELVFVSVSGEVISNEKRVIVEGEGGGGDISNGYGTIDSININSRIEHEIWIKTEKGNEESYVIKDAKLPLRTGQLVTIVECYSGDSDDSLLFALVNHTADKVYYLNRQSDIVRKFKLTSRYIGSYFLAIMIVLFFLLSLPFLFVVGIFNSSFFSMFIVLLFFITYIYIFVRGLLWVNKILVSDNIYRKKLKVFIGEFMGEIIRA